MSCLVAVQAAFELFFFGSRHDFLISDFCHFVSVTPIKSIFYLARWWQVTLIFLLLFLIVEGRLKNLSSQEGFRNVLLPLYIFWKSFDQEKGQ